MRCRPPRCRPRSRPAGAPRGRTSSAAACRHRWPVRGRRGGPASEMIRVAHASSACGVAFAAGRQMKIRCRLGVSPLPPGLYGPGDGERQHVRDAKRVARVVRAANRRASRDRDRWPRPCRSRPRVMSWGPGVSRTLMRDRSSIWSPITVLFARFRMSRRALTSSWLADARARTPGEHLRLGRERGTHCAGRAGRPRTRRRGRGQHRTEPRRDHHAPMQGVAGRRRPPARSARDPPCIWPTSPMLARPRRRRACSRRAARWRRSAIC